MRKYNDYILISSERKKPIVCTHLFIALQETEQKETFRLWNQFPVMSTKQQLNIDEIE